MAAREDLDLGLRRRIAHLQRREPIELRGIDAERAGELAAAIDRRDELDVVGDVEDRFEGIVVEDEPERGGVVSINQQCQLFVAAHLVEPCSGERG